MFRDKRIKNNSSFFKIKTTKMHTDNIKIIIIIIIGRSRANNSDLISGDKIPFKPQATCLDT